MSSRDPSELLAHISTVPKNLPKMIYCAISFYLKSFKRSQTISHSSYIFFNSTSVKLIYDFELDLCQFDLCFCSWLMLWVLIWLSCHRGKGIHRDRDDIPPKGPLTGNNRAGLILCFQWSLSFERHVSCSTRHRLEVRTPLR